MHTLDHKFGIPVSSYYFASRRSSAEDSLDSVDQNQNRTIYQDEAVLLLGLCEAKGFGIYPVVEAATSTKRQATHRKMLTGVSECTYGVRS